MHMLVCVLAVCLASAPAFGYLKIHPDNPHYFQETANGKPVILIGHGSIVPPVVDNCVAELKSHGIGYARVWHLGTWGKHGATWPWALSSAGGAYHGGPKADFDTWNPRYWTRMKYAMKQANDAGIYSEIMLFDRCWMSPPAMDRWGGNPWASDNNINDLETQPGSGDGVPEFYQFSTKPNLRKQQERYVRKMIDETIAYPNIIYEIENEHWGPPSADWAGHYAKFVKDYIAANYPKSPRLVSHSSIESDADLDACFSIAAIDIVNRHYGGEPEADPRVINDYLEPRWKHNKPISIDEFANGSNDVNLLRQECWIIITSGGNFHIEDADDGICYTVLDNMRSFLASSGWDFIHAAPNKALITSGGGYCMAQPGVEYFCYFPSGGSKTITLTAADYRAEWWNPRTGGFSHATIFTHAGGGKTLATPDSSDWVLHITAPTARTGPRSGSGPHGYARRPR